MYLPGIEVLDDIVSLCGDGPAWKSRDADLLQHTSKKKKKNSNAFIGKQEFIALHTQQMINKHTDIYIIRNTFLPCRNSEISSEIDMPRLCYVML